MDSSWSIQRAGSIEPRAPKFLWRGRVPAGMVTLLAGRPGSAKSMLTVLIAAEESQRKGARVLMLAREDPAHEVLRPRLEAAGANLNRVEIVTEARLPDDLPELQRELESATLLTIDPIAAHLSRSVSRYNDSIRTITTPLERTARETGAGILLVDHVVKKASKTAHPLQAIGGGGSGIAAAARQAFIVGKDPEDSERIIAACVKQFGPPALALGFVLDSASYVAVDGREATAGVLLPEDEEFGYDARLLIAGDAGQKKQAPSKRAAASEWLAHNLMPAEGHARPKKSVEEDARKAGITRSTLRRAARDMGIDTKTEPSGTWWVLPPEVAEAMGTE